MDGDWISRKMKPNADTLVTLYRQSGLATVHHAGWDAYLVIFARAARMFAYGVTSLTLALFLTAIGTSDFRVGLFMTLTLAGDVVLGLALTLFADHLGRRLVLLGGSVLMVLSGVIFALYENFWILLVAAVLGVLSANGSDVGPFRAIEESILSQLTSTDGRADILCWYVTMASLGSAAGTGIMGHSLDYLLKDKDANATVDAYHTCFWVYVAAGTVNIVCCLCLSPKCELVVKGEKTTSADALNLAERGDEVEIESLLTDDSDNDAGGNKIAATSQAQSKSKSFKSPFKQISRKTLAITVPLWLLLMVDALADGMVNMSLTTYYVTIKFPNLSKTALGGALSASYFVCSLMVIFAGPLSRHIGLVATMVFTHVPSSTAVLLFPAASSVALMYLLLVLRIGLNNMDQAPRTALIAAIVKADERTAAMGVTNMLKTLASTIGPSITGVLAGDDRFWVAFVVAGVLRLAYDFGLFAMFINIKVGGGDQEDEEERV